MSAERPISIALSPREWSAARAVVTRVLEEVPAELVEAALFGSKARGDARSDSDVDILLVFSALPPDREPQAGMAERIAEQVAQDTGVPVTVWSVALVDLEWGCRTPMLVDALADGLPIWCWPEPLECVPFTPEDALRCCNSLLDRVEEGSAEFITSLRHADEESAARRVRDDLVRLCTALLLLRGLTRPRRARAIDTALAIEFSSDPPPRAVTEVLDWAMQSFGPNGRHENLPLRPPPGDLMAAARAVDYLRKRVNASAERLAHKA